MTMDFSSSSIILMALCGLPASGKSTLAQRIYTYLLHYSSQRNTVPSLSSSMQHISFTCDILSFDSIYDNTMVSPQRNNDTSSQYTARTTNENSAESISSSIIDKWSPERWHQSRYIALQKLHQLIQKYRNSTSISTIPQEVSSSASSASVVNKTIHLIIIDDNLWLRSMRKDIYRLARDYRLYYVCLYFPIINMEKCIEYDKQRREIDTITTLDDGTVSSSSRTSTYVGETIIRRMAANFEPPVLFSMDTNASSDTADMNHCEPTVPSSISLSAVGRWDSQYTIIIDSDKNRVSGISTIVSTVSSTIPNTVRKVVDNEPSLIVEKLVNIVTESSNEWLPPLTTTIEYQQQRLQQATNDREKTAKNIVQQTDLYLRSLVNSVLNGIQQNSHGNGKEATRSSSSSSSTTSSSSILPEESSRLVAQTLEKLQTFSSFRLTIQQQQLGKEISKIRKTVLSEIKRYLEHHNNHYDDFIEDYSNEILEIVRVSHNTNDERSLFFIYEPSSIVSLQKQKRPSDNTTTTTVNNNPADDSLHTSSSLSSSNHDKQLPSSSDPPLSPLLLLSLYELDKPWIIDSQNTLSRFLLRLFLFRVMEEWITE